MLTHIYTSTTHDHIHPQYRWDGAPENKAEWMLTVCSLCQEQWFLAAEMGQGTGFLGGVGTGVEAQTMKV